MDSNHEIHQSHCTSRISRLQDSFLVCAVLPSFLEQPFALLQKLAGKNPIGNMRAMPITQQIKKELQIFS